MVLERKYYQVRDGEQRQNFVREKDKTQKRKRVVFEDVKQSEVLQDTNRI